MDWENLMDIDELYEFCLSLPQTSSDFPFDKTTLCFRVNKKIFAITDIEQKPTAISLKCLPDLTLELREKFTCITAAYHMNKSHWNSVVVDGSLTKASLHALIKHSYALVFRSLTKNEQANSLLHSPEIQNILENFSNLSIEQIR
jgi:predicted DNA-binding protein (MmcQ/YjbR family)